MRGASGSLESLRCFLEGADRTPLAAFRNHAPEDAVGEETDGWLRPLCEWAAGGGTVMVITRPLLVSALHRRIRRHLQNLGVAAKCPLAAGYPLSEYPSADRISRRVLTAPPVSDSDDGDFRAFLSWFQRAGSTASLSQWLNHGGGLFDGMASLLHHDCEANPAETGQRRFWDNENWVAQSRIVVASARYAVSRLITGSVRPDLVAVHAVDDLVNEMLLLDHGPVPLAGMVRQVRFLHRMGMPADAARAALAFLESARSRSFLPGTNWTLADDGVTECAACLLDAATGYLRHLQDKRILAAWFRDIAFLRRLAGRRDRCARPILISENGGGRSLLIPDFRRNSVRERLLEMLGSGARRMLLVDDADGLDALPVRREEIGIYGGGGCGCRKGRMRLGMLLWPGMPASVLVDNVPKPVLFLFGGAADEAEAAVWLEACLGNPDVMTARLWGGKRMPQRSPKTVVLVGFPAPDRFLAAIDYWHRNSDLRPAGCGHTPEAHADWCYQEAIYRLGKRVRALLWKYDPELLLIACDDGGQMHDSRRLELVRRVIPSCCDRAAVIRERLLIGNVRDLLTTFDK